MLNFREFFGIVVVMKAYQLNTIVDNDSQLGYETNGPIKRVFNIILTPILNNFPSSFRGFIKKTHHSAKKVIEKATTHEAIEVLYDHKNVVSQY